MTEEELDVVRELVDVIKRLDLAAWNEMIPGSVLRDRVVKALDEADALVEWHQKEGVGIA